MKKEIWGPLADRYDNNKPRKILALDGGGIRAVDTNGKDLGSHQAFWFAWSQFHPKTELWGG